MPDNEDPASTQPTAAADDPACTQPTADDESDTDEGLTLYNQLLTVICGLWQMYAMKALYIRGSQDGNNCRD